MRHALAAAAIACVLLSQPAPAQSRAAGLLVGRVVDGVTGQPVPSVRVRLTPANLPPLGAVLTGADGRFVFAALPAGRYDLRASRPGYLEGAHGRRRPEGSVLPLELADDERRGSIEILVWPIASISGRVFDDQAQPLGGATVSATRVPPVGLPDGPPDGTALTDASGAWRIDGLAPGRYAVSVRCHVLSAIVSPDAGPIAPGASTHWERDGTPTITRVPGDASRFAVVSGPVRDAAVRPASVFMTTWFGNVTRAADTTPVDLSAGQDHAGVAITMAATRAVHVTGRVLGLERDEFAAIRLLPSDHDTRRSADAVEPLATAHVDPDGRFTLPGVAPGDYLAQVAGLWQAPRTLVSPLGVPDVRAIGRVTFKTVWANVQITVPDAPDADVLLTVPEPVTVNGSVEFAIPPPAGASSLQVIVVGSIAQTVKVDGTWRFSVDDLRPGWITVSAARLPPNWSVLSVRVGSREVAGVPFRVERDMPEVIVTVGPSAEVRGAIRDGSGPADDATVLLFPADPRYWDAPADRSLRVQSHRTSTGEFSFAGMPAGEYHVIAIDPAAMADWPAPEFLRRLAVSAARVTATSGVTQQVALAVDRTVR